LLCRDCGELWIARSYGDFNALARLLLLDHARTKLVCSDACGASYELDGDFDITAVIRGHLGGYQSTHFTADSPAGWLIFNFMGLRTHLIYGPRAFTSSHLTRAGLLNRRTI
jgi:hypothetical protein